MSPNKDNSLLVMKKAVLNGKNDTISKLGTGCFASHMILDSSPKKNLGASKFSQAINEVSKEPSNFEQAVNEEFSPSGRRLKSNTTDLRKQAMIHNFNSSPKKIILENIPDENPLIKSNWEDKKSGIEIKYKNFD